MTRIRTINQEIDVKTFSHNFIVVSVLLDNQYRRDRCEGCGWGAWPDPSDVTEMTQRFGPLTTIGAYRWNDRMDAVEAVEDFMSRQGFTKVDPGDYEGLPVSTCLTAHYPAATRHRIATLLVPYRLDAPKRIFNFIDDQGYDADLYFTDADENTFKLVMKKLANT